MASTTLFFFRLPSSLALAVLPSDPPWQSTVQEFGPDGDFANRSHRRARFRAKDQRGARLHLLDCAIRGT